MYKYGSIYIEREVRIWHLIRQLNMKRNMFLNSFKIKLDKFLKF